MKINEKTIFPSLIYTKNLMFCPQTLNLRRCPIRIFFEMLVYFPRVHRCTSLGTAPNCENLKIFRTLPQGWVGFSFAYQKVVWYNSAQTMISEATIPVFLTAFYIHLNPRLLASRRDKRLPFASL